MKRCGIERLICIILGVLLVFCLASCGCRADFAASETSDAFAQVSDASDPAAEKETVPTEGKSTEPAVPAAEEPLLDDAGEALSKESPVPEASIMEAVPAADNRAREDRPAAGGLTAEPLPETKAPFVSAEENGPASSEETAPKQEEAAAFVTITVQCRSVIDRLDELSEEKRSFVTEDGIMLARKTVAIEEGDTVYEVLLRSAAEAGLALDEKNSLGSVYIRGIGGLFEFDCGKGSGWMYKVNGIAPNYGCSRVGVRDGDEIEWYYVCD